MDEEEINLNQLGPQTTGQSIGSIMTLAAKAAPAVMGYFQSKKARELADIEETKRLALDSDLQSLLSNRQQLRNPYANLSVNTQAAEFQAQQTDAALANTLDTMRAGGFGASGATALARKAAEAKQGVAADISTQEQSNRKLFAKGEADLQTAVEDRQIQDINRKQMELDNARQNEQDLRDEQRVASQVGIGSAITGVAGALSDNPNMLSGLFGLDASGQDRGLSKAFSAYQSGSDDYGNVPSGLTIDQFTQFHTP